jgi:ribosomal protein S27AE|tara:strand:+ start:98 stop:235 length:138 start_codon:yes stop_codon:yes gene_type:complete
MGVQKSMQSLKAEEDNKVCPECGSKDIVKDKGEIYCNKCGYVISD